MPALDFKEIPEANIAIGEQDTFELFARDFLEYLGYKILSGPDRGADGGRDLIVSELRVGIAGESTIKWLVSCKHNAHTGKSVGTSQESDIIDRVRANQCQGFLGFYSTLPSSSLTKKLEGIQDIQKIIYDNKLITKKLLGSMEGLQIAKQYFPRSIKSWLDENPSPAKIFSDKEFLRCDYCGKDLLNPPSGIYVYLSKYPAKNKILEVEDIYFACKGKCDEKVNKKLMRKDLSDGWNDIDDLTVPLIYIKSVMSVINNLHDKRIHYSKAAIEKLRMLLVLTFPYVSRNQTEKEKKIIKEMMMIPEYFGGLAK